MDGILDYFRDMIDENAEMQEWNAKKHLSLYLAGCYDYWLVTLLGEQILLMAPVEDFLVARSKKHMSKIKEITGYETVLCFKELSFYLAQKMMKERMSFIAVDRQMYLPFLALQIRLDMKRKAENVEREKFTPSAQLVFLYMLYSDESAFGLQETAEALGITSMSVLRAMNELKAIGVITEKTAGKTGRKKLYFPIEKSEYFRFGREHIMNPVRKTIYVKRIPEEIKVYRSGLDALALKTIIAEPDHPIFAAYTDEKLFADFKVSNIEGKEEKMSEIQLLYYDAGKLTTDDCVDPITLISTIKNKDERIEIVIEEMMEDKGWYVD